MDIILNSLVFIDLNLTLKNPFYPREKRKPLFFLLCIIPLIIQLTQYFIHYHDYEGDMVEL